MNTEQLLKASIAHEENKKIKGEWLIKELAEKITRLQTKEMRLTAMVAFALCDFEGSFDPDTCEYSQGVWYLEAADFMKRGYGRDDAGMIIRVHHWLNDFIPEEWQIP